MIKLVVGLGNPDKEYDNTFHNLGFSAIDKLAEKFGAEFNKTKCHAKISEFKVGKDKIILAKPLTYMNLSGVSVRELISFYKIDLNDILIIYDDFDLEKFSLRLREEGSAGTHNGMKNIIKELGATGFKRIRIGFKPESDNKIPLIDLVLSGIPAIDKEGFDVTVLDASSAAYDFIVGVDFVTVMQKYNGKRYIKN